MKTFNASCYVILTITTPKLFNCEMERLKFLEFLQQFPTYCYKKSKGPFCVFDDHSIY